MHTHTHTHTHTQTLTIQMPHARHVQRRSDSTAGGSLNSDVLPVHSHAHTHTHAHIHTHALTIQNPYIMLNARTAQLVSLVAVMEPPHTRTHTHTTLHTHTHAHTSTHHTDPLRHAQRRSDSTTGASRSSDAVSRHCTTGPLRAQGNLKRKHVTRDHDITRQRHHMHRISSDEHVA